MTNYLFGPYILRNDPPQLLRDGNEVELGARGLAILNALAGHHDQTLSKRRLIELVWPGAEATDNSVHVHINALRNRLGRELIMTVPGEGYRLNATVRPLGKSASLDVLAGFLPVHVIGRESETSELTRLLRAHSLVTLAGPGGIGKTALARHVVAALQDEYPDGVIWVDVSSAIDTMQITAAAATAAGLRRCADERGRGLATELSARTALLVLDNAENLISEVAAFCQSLTLRASGLRVLVTSQAPMLLAGEWVMRLDGLATPPEGASAEESRRFGAVQLFVERAQSSPGFVLTDQNAAAVDEICRLCDGVPLAIELVAAQVGAIGSDPKTLERALLAMSDEGAARRDAPERQKTIRAALDWSLQTLPVAEREMLSALAVFNGGFTSDAAAAVLQQPADVVQLRLAHLVGRSLVTVRGDPPRYRLFNLIRRLLLERLAASEFSATVSRRHADYYTALGAQFHAMLTEDSGRNLGRVIEEAANLRVALKWATGPGQSPSHALTLCGNLDLYWEATARYSQARRCVNDALRLPGADAPELRGSRLRAINSAAVAALYQGDHAAARPLFEEMIALARDLDQPKQEAWALQGLGTCALRAGRSRQAIEAASAALRIMESIGEASGVAAANTTLVLAYIDQEDLEAARRAADAALVSARAGGTLFKAAFAHGALAKVLWLQGELEASEGHVQTAFELATQSKSLRGVAQAECGLGRIRLARGDVGSAAAHYLRGLGILLETDAGETFALVLIGAAVALLRGGRAADAVACRHGRGAGRRTIGSALHTVRPP